jgi:hypothetical protein
LHHDAGQRAESFDDLEHIFVPESTRSAIVIGAKSYHLLEQQFEKSNCPHKTR